MAKMFKKCSSLESLDITNFNTQSVNDMTEMFNTITSLKVLNLTSFVTKNVNKYTDIFGGNEDLEVLINKNNNPNIILNPPEGITITDVN